MTGRAITYKLRNWRRLNQLSQAMAASRLGIARRTWLQWERGATVPAQEHMVRLIEITAGAIEPNDFYDLTTTDGADWRKDAA